MSRTVSKEYTNKFKEIYRKLNVDNKYVIKLYLKKIKINLEDFGNISESVTTILEEKGMKFNELENKISNQTNSDSVKITFHRIKNKKIKKSVYDEDIAKELNVTVEEIKFGNRDYFKNKERKNIQIKSSQINGVKVRPINPYNKPTLSILIKLQSDDLFRLSYKITKLDKNERESLLNLMECMLEIQEKRELYISYSELYDDYNNYIE
ncbi:hypothetical protein ACSXCI_01965 [Clostridium perfringens]